MESIMKSTKIAQKIFQILFWGIVVVSIALLLFLAIGFLLVDPDAVVLIRTFPLGDFILNVNQEVSCGQLMGLLWLSWANMAVWAGLCCYTIKILQGIFEPMSQGKPFHTSVSDGLKQLSYAVVVFGVINLILQVPFNIAYENFVATLSPFDASTVESSSTSLIGNFTFVIWFLLLRLFRQIVQYGETLQQLSDETL